MLRLEQRDIAYGAAPCTTSPYRSAVGLIPLEVQCEILQFHRHAQRFARTLPYLDECIFMEALAVQQRRNPNHDDGHHPSMKPAATARYAASVAAGQAYGSGLRRRKI